MSRRGMTLLELLIALTMLVAITTLVATLWSQMRRWADDTMKLDGALRPQRAAAFVRTQWSERRALAPLGARSRASAQLVGDSLEFTTASSALFPGWPLVKARYTIERGISPTGLPVDAPSKLIYEESRVVRLDSLAELVSGAVDANGEELTRRTVLIDGAVGLRWETLRAAGDGKSAGPVWREIGSGAEIGLEEAAAAAETRPQPKEGEEERPDRKAAPPDAARRPATEGRAADEKPEPPRAVRLAGKLEGREIAWSLVVAGSR